MPSKDGFQKFSGSSFVVNKSLTLLSSHSYWSEESYDLEGKSVEFVVSFKGRGMAIAGIGTAKCFHGATTESNNGGGDRWSAHVGRSKFVVRKSGVKVVSRDKKLPNQERAKIIFKMKDGVLLVSFIVGSSSSEIRDDESSDEETEFQIGMMPPDDQRYYLYMRAPPGVHDVKFHDINIRNCSDDMMSMMEDATDARSSSRAVDDNLLEKTTATITAISQTAIPQTTIISDGSSSISNHRVVELEQQVQDLTGELALALANPSGYKKASLLEANKLKVIIAQDQSIKKLKEQNVRLQKMNKIQKEALFELTSAKLKGSP